MMMRKTLCFFCLFLFLFCGNSQGNEGLLFNNNVLNVAATRQDKTRQDKTYSIRETDESVDGKHRISTFVTRDQGMGLLIDDKPFLSDDINIRYSPGVSNNGNAVWCQQTPGVGYDLMLDHESILHSGACLHFVTMGTSQGICIESDTGKDLTRVYGFDVLARKCDCIGRLQNEYIEETCVYNGNHFGVIASHYDATGNKLYNVYQVNGEDWNVQKIIENYSGLITFPHRSKEDSMLLDFIQISENDRYFYNAYRIDLHGNNEAFAHGNDFRGRISWGESYRLRGLCELYAKNPTSELKNRISRIVENILCSTNAQTGIVDNEWNIGCLWASKAYSIDYVPVSLIVDNSEILSSLLTACNCGIITKDRDCYKKVLDCAINAFEYYDQWYRDGHYYLPYGSPMTFDGIVVPWNWQNSFAEVCLGLYLETREGKYLDRCNELIASFQSEWIEENDRIYWHYWPMAFYAGWEDDGRSVHTPAKKASEDTLFEDASHAGISVRLLNRYYENIQDGFVAAKQLEKIKKNMDYFCLSNGFSRFISGDDQYVPIRWHYWVSPYYSYLHNEIYARYVLQGYLKCFPDWDSNGQLFAYARLYDPQIPGTEIVVERKEMNDKGQGTTIDTYKIQRDELKAFISQHYDELASEKGGAFAPAFDVTANEKARRAITAFFGEAEDVESSLDNVEIGAERTVMDLNNEQFASVSNDSSAIVAILPEITPQKTAVYVFGIDCSEALEGSLVWHGFPKDLEGKAALSTSGECLFLNDNGERITAIPSNVHINAAVNLAANATYAPVVARVSSNNDNSDSSEKNDDSKDNSEGIKTPTFDKNGGGCDTGWTYIAILVLLPIALLRNYGKR